MFSTKTTNSIPSSLNTDLQAELTRIRKEMQMSDEDFELGKKSPRDLAIKWLCRAISVSTYDWKNHELLKFAIDRLIALDNAQNAQHQCCCGNNECQDRNN